MTTIPFHVGDCVLVYNYLSDGYDKYTLQRRLPASCAKPMPRWEAISDKGDTATFSEYEMDHAPREHFELVGSLIVALGVIGVLVGAAFGMGMFSL